MAEMGEKFHKPNSTEQTPSVEKFKPPQTLLRAGRDFYMSRGKDHFVLDVPFRPAPNAPTTSVGDSISELLIAHAAHFKQVREDFSSFIPSTESSLRKLKKDLSSLVYFAAKRKNYSLSPADKESLQKIVDQLDERIVEQLTKESEKQAKDERRKDLEELEEQKKAIKEGRPIVIQRSEPVAPDDLARIQRIFSKKLIDGLRTEDGTTFEELISKVTGGEIKKVMPTGLWRDREALHLIEAATEDENISGKRRIVDQFLITLPNIARLAAEGVEGLSREEKFKIRLAAQAIYERATQLRSDRLNVSETTAQETSRLVDLYGKAYKTLYNYGVVPPLPEPLDFDEKQPGQSQSEYEASIRKAAEHKERLERTAEYQFNAKRKGVIAAHLLAFDDAIHNNKSMTGMFPGALGPILGAVGKDGLSLYRSLMQDIQTRVLGEVFTGRTKKLPSTEGHLPYVVLDEAERTLKQPPEHFRNRLDDIYSRFALAEKTLQKNEDEIRNIYFEIVSPVFTDSVLLAKRLDIAEADLKIGDIYSAIADEYKLTKSRGEAGSLLWKATSDLTTKRQAIEYRLQSLREDIRSAREKILIKLVAQTAQEIAKADDMDKYENLKVKLTELELVARDKNSTAEQLKDAISFFLE